MALFILSGLVVHDFLSNDSVRFFGITVTYLRLVLLLAIPLFLYSNPFFRKKDPFFLFLALFLLYSLTRIGENYREALSIYSVFVAFLMIYTLIQDNEGISKCINFVAGCSIALVLYGLFEMITGVHFAETYFQEYYGTANVGMLATGMYYNENDFSALLTVLVFYMLLSDFGKAIKCCFVGLAVIIIYCNDSNICLLGLLAFASFFFVSKSRNSRQAVFRTFTLLAILIIAIPFLIGSSSLYWRSVMYSYGVRVCEAFPLFGTGLGNYSAEISKLGLTPDGNVSTDPHSLFLELAGQYGVFWLIMLLVMLVALIGWYAKRLENDRIRYMLGLVLIIFFIGLASSSCMEKNYVYLALLVPLMFWKVNRSSRNSRLIDLAKQNASYNMPKVQLETTPPFAGKQTPSH